MKTLTILAFAVVSILGVMWASQRRLIYFPAQLAGDAATAPSHMVEVMYPTDDGLTLAAWYAPAMGNPNGDTIIVFPGNAGARSDRVPLARALAESGFAVLLVDYRGYGGNPGRPSESGLASDARAALDYLMTREDTDADRLIFFGESLGAGVALGLAQHQEPAALILRSPFTSLSDVGAHHYPLLPVSLLLWDRFPNRDRIGNIDAPILVIAGSNDRTVPLSQSQELFDVASEPKRLVVVDGADHNDLVLTASTRLVDEITAFLNEVSS